MKRCSRCEKLNLGLTLGIKIIPDTYGLSDTTLCHSCWLREQKVVKTVQVDKESDYIPVVKKVQVNELRKVVSQEQIASAQTMNTPTAFEAIQLLHEDAEAFTKEKLSAKPRGADDPAILPHVLKALAGDQLVTFGRDRSSSADAPAHMMHALKPDSGSIKHTWDLEMSGPPDWCATSDLFTNQQAIDEFKAEARRRIAKSLGVSEERIRIASLKKVASSHNLRWTILLPQRRHVFSPRMSQAVCGGSSTRIGH